MYCIVYQQIEIERHVRLIIAMKMLFNIFVQKDTLWKNIMLEQLMGIIQLLLNSQVRLQISLLMLKCFIRYSFWL